MEIVGLAELESLCIQAQESPAHQPSLTEEIIGLFSGRFVVLLSLSCATRFNQIILLRPIP